MTAIANRAIFKHKKRWVIKIGSALMTKNGRGLATDSIQLWAQQIAKLYRQGYVFVIVSSGAVAEGMTQLNLSARPSALHQLQACAAVGQMGLIQAWEQAFSAFEIRTAQVLLTHDDLKNRRRYLNARSTLQTLLEMGVVPIVNENDTVATDEIRFGDNDSLAAMVSNLVEANALLILTDQDGLFSEDPRQNPNAKLITSAMADEKRIEKMAGDGGELGRGGMITKVKAAQIAAQAGAHTVIANGNHEQVIATTIAGKEIGTWLQTDSKTVNARKLWIIAQLHIKGQISVDQGAATAILKQHKSLLPIGATAVNGSFERGDLVAISYNGQIIAKGLSNYNHIQVAKIIGLSSKQSQRALGFAGDTDLINRDNLVLE